MTAAAEDIRAARFPEDSEAALAIFREYVASPSVSLDVLPEFTAARRLYAELGFLDAEPVSFNPIPGTAFLGRDLPYAP
ncbi:hypothetical protein [Azonexus fungiphilus]|uniref:hypothetical protein n=1 Tax=Azonexus fungiphilus TaxID=146940 RepID=UPI00156B8043|nr:hypothetical protein [Azonexus fungiphilus]NHC07302.1 hypothetical protein [Azonexus fungiphilus]